MENYDFPLIQNLSFVPGRRNRFWDGSDEK